MARRTPVAASSTPVERKEKVRQCDGPNCEATFVQRRMEHRFCGLRCLKAREKADAKAAADADKAKKQELKRRNDLVAEAQEAFRAFIRARDFDQPCVSCGLANPPMKPGGQWDAGHFLGRGAYPELAFEELNCWRQCKACNAGSGKFSAKARTVAQKYEAELERRIGPERLAWLKGPHAPKKWTREQLVDLKAHYRAKTRELLKARAA